MRFCGIRLRAISQWMPKFQFCIIRVSVSPTWKYLKNEGRDMENWWYSLQQIFQISQRWDLKSNKPKRNTDNEFENYIFKITVTFPGDQWVKSNMIRTLQLSVTWFPALHLSDQQFAQWSTKAQAISLRVKWCFVARWRNVQATHRNKCVWSMSQRWTSKGV